MNELPSSSDNKPDAAPETAPPATTAAPENAAPAAPARPLSWLLLGALALLALLVLGLWWSTQQDLRAVREEVAQRLRSGETAYAATHLIAKSAQDAMKELQAKVSVLESKQGEAQSQQLALEQMYHDLARTRDEWAMAEIEQVLYTATQQLQLAGNVQGAIIALQNADARLARADTPQFMAVRRAIGNDLERLKALPSIDLTGIALRLDSAIGQIDGMPLLSDEKPAASTTEPKTPRRAAPQAGVQDGEDWRTRLENIWHSWTNEAWNEIKQVVRVRNVESSDALLLSPTQAFYVRENLKLRLLNARLALITRNESVFRSDLTAAQDAVAQYFDARARQTQAVQALLRQVQASNLVIEMPTLAESLGAVRNFKAKP